jgi:hypothetical protein
MPGSVRALRMYWLDSTRILAVGAADTNRFMLLDSSGSLIGVRASELLGGDSITKTARLSVSTGVKVCPAPGMGRWAMIFLGAGRIDLYDNNAVPLRPFDVPIPSNGYFVRDSSGRWAATIPRLHYVDCAGTRKYLYTIYSGRHRNAFTGTAASNGRYLEVYTWDGRLEHVYEFDADVGYLAVDGDSVVYTTANEATSIRRYRLPLN